MPRKHAARGEGHDAGILRIDERTKAVMTDHPRHAQEAFREQIARVRDVVPSCNKDDIPLVLQYFDGDVEKTIQSFVDDGGAAILQEWRSSGKKGKPANKRNKKKRKAQQNGGASAGSGAAPLEEKEGVSEPTVNAQSISRSTGNTSHPSASQSTTPSTAKPQSDRPQFQDRPQDRPRQQRNRREDRNRPYQRPHTAPDGAHDGRQGRLAGGATAAATVPKTQPAAAIIQGQSSVQRPSIQDLGQMSHAAETREPVPREIHLSHTHESVKTKKLGAALEKSSKDLHRTKVALTRHKTQLRDKLDQSEKSIKKSFDELHRFLTERELVLTNNFLDVKREATDMLDGREEQAKELEKQIHRIGTMSEDQLMELRADIKHFVSDRKVDEEIGRAIRFTWNPDNLIELIKNFGEVVPVQHHYSTRRPSVSSLSSINTVSRTTSVSEEPASLSRSTSLSESHDSSSVFKTPPPPSQLDPVAEAAKMAARLQRSMQQGRKGPRNPRGPNNQGDQGQKDGERSNPANRGQGQGSGQSHAQGPNPNRQGRNQNRPDRQRPQEHGQKQGNVANVSDEQGQEKRWSNKNMRRRQNNNRKRQEERAKSEQANGGDVSAQSQTDTGTSDRQPLVQNRPSSSTNDVTETVPVHPVKKDESNVNQSEEIPRNETYHIGNGEMSPRSSIDINEQKVQIKKPVKIEPPTTNGSLVNGDVKMNGNIPHLDGQVNGDIGDALPQRDPKPRRAPRMEQVVKETSALNGMVDFESAEREN